MNEIQISEFKRQLELALGQLMIETSTRNKNVPEMMIGVMYMSTAGNFCENMKGDYVRLKNEFENKNLHFGLSKQQHSIIVDEITTKVLGTYIVLPNNTSDLEDGNYDF